MGPIIKRLLRNPKQALALAITISLFCAANSAQADTKVATIKFKDVVERSQQYITASKSATDEFTKRQSALEAAAKKLNDDAEKFAQTQDTLGADARQSAEKDLQTRQLDQQYAEKQLQDDSTARNRQLTERLVARIGQVIGQIAQEKHYDLVLVDPAYAASGTDISDEVLKRLNNLPVDLK